MLNFYLFVKKNIHKMFHQYCLLNYLLRVIENENIISTFKFVINVGLQPIYLENMYHIVVICTI